MARDIFSDVPTNPFRDLQRFGGMLDPFFSSPWGWRGSAEYPPVNIWTGEDKAVLTAELPGIDPDELDITVKNDTVTLRGCRDGQADDEEERDFVRRERPTGNFARTFRLPFSVDADQVNAEYRRGVLELTLPRAEKDKPKKIEVKNK